jgi:2OG-Fe(II) oxygenase superfamily
VLRVAVYSTIHSNRKRKSHRSNITRGMANEPNQLPMASPPLPLPSVEVLIENQCYWVHSALTIHEQIQVLGDILDRCKPTTDGRDPRKRTCMNPSPETLFLEDGYKPTLRFGNFHDDNISAGECSENDPGDVPLSSVYNECILQKVTPLVFPKLQNLPYQNNSDVNARCSNCPYNGYSVGVIRYDAPNGSFPEHIDHCNENPWVVLLSLGCTARFSVRNKDMASKKILELTSGDVVVFDPSTKAAIRHGVISILPSTCPRALQQAFGVEATANHRYGVQCRTSLKK